MALQLVPRGIRTPTVKRIVHYYEIRTTPNQAHQLRNLTHFLDTMNDITRRVIDRHESRYIGGSKGKLMMHELSFQPTEQTIRGKLLLIRNDVFPQLFNETNDIAREIEAAEDDGILETSHFIIDYRRTNPVMAMEFNHAGAKISDMVYYIERMGRAAGIIDGITVVPITGTDIEGFIRRINRCSELMVRIHRDNIPQVENIETGLFTALTAVAQQFENDYVSIVYDVDYKQVQDTPRLRDAFISVIRAVIRRPGAGQVFDKLILRAEDEDRNNLLESFDLMVDKVKSVINVERRERSRTVVSSDIFAKMRREMTNSRINP